MKQLGSTLERLGQALSLLGGATLALVILIVIINGRWPVFLEPVRSRFELISGFLGDYAIIVEGLCFVGPGLLIAWIGGWLKDSNRDTT